MHPLSVLFGTVNVLTQNNYAFKKYGVISTHTKPSQFFKRWEETFESLFSREKGVESSRKVDLGRTLNLTDSRTLNFPSRGKPDRGSLRGLEVRGEMTVNDTLRTRKTEVRFNLQGRSGSKGRPPHPLVGPVRS